MSNPWSRARGGRRRAAGPCHGSRSSAVASRRPRYSRVGTVEAERPADGLAFRAHHESNRPTSACRGHGLAKRRRDKVPKTKQGHEKVRRLTASQRQRNGTRGKAARRFSWFCCTSGVSGGDSVTDIKGCFYQPFGISTHFYGCNSLIEGRHPLEKHLAV